MALEEKDINFIKQHIGEWLAEASLGKPPAVYEIELRERMVRVEEELKHQRELIQQVLTMMDRRFDAADSRFDAADSRFEALTRRLDRFMFWSFGITVSSAGVVIAVLRFWPPV